MSKRTVKAYPDSSSTITTTACPCLPCSCRSVLLGTLRAAITRPFQRLPAATAAFLAEAGGLAGLRLRGTHNLSSGCLQLNSLNGC